MLWFTFSALPKAPYLNTSVSGIFGCAESCGPRGRAPCTAAWTCLWAFFCFRPLSKLTNCWVIGPVTHPNKAYVDSKIQESALDVFPLLQKGPDSATYSSVWQECLDMLHNTELLKMSLGEKTFQYLSHLFPILWHSKVLPISLE